jgi:hypothetical protein
MDPDRHVLPLTPGQQNSCPFFLPIHLTLSCFLLPSCAAPLPPDLSLSNPLRPINCRQEVTWVRFPKPQQASPVTLASPITFRMRHSRPPGTISPLAKTAAYSRIDAEATDTTSGVHVCCRMHSSRTGYRDQYSIA